MYGARPQQRSQAEHGLSFLQVQGICVRSRSDPNLAAPDRLCMSRMGSGAGCALAASRQSCWIGAHMPAVQLHPSALKA
ncbi:hypothetical protein N7462_006437 [Penicillium macrosclerotiorum]|uniref:uncharacterized protein n=1 Tax=Penicillium macrosclerotiorum TaxID=303699 RepID=UPI002547514C|nr:uncharacterized protein N7462_006437 [Penicillium macrosclerotiorum]KAJ5683272.1 hypothetical protein N7462_006437 [Penicillium macrosclerotiorum]